MLLIAQNELLGRQRRRVLPPIDKPRAVGAQPQKTKTKKRRGKDTHLAQCSRANRRCNAGAVHSACFDNLLLNAAGVIIPLSSSHLLLSSDNQPTFSSPNTRWGTGEQPTATPFVAAHPSSISRVWILGASWASCLTNSQNTVPGQTTPVANISCCVCNDRTPFRPLTIVRPISPTNHFRPDFPFLLAFASVHDVAHICDIRRNPRSLQPWISGGQPTTILLAQRGDTMATAR